MFKLGYSELVSNEQLENYKIRFDNTLRQNKLLACLTLVKSSITRGNQDLINSISTTQLDRKDFYNKYILAMMNQCTTTITNEDAYLVISSDFDYDKNQNNVQKLIKIKGDEIKKTNLTENEVNILSDINSVIKEHKRVNKDVESLKKFESFYPYIIIGIILFAVFFGIYSISIMLKRKAKDPKTRKEEEETIRDILALKKRN